MAKVKKLEAASVKLPIKLKRAPLKPTTKQARDMISIYVGKAIAGKTTEVTFYGRPFAVIEPLPLGKDLSSLPKVTTTEIKASQRTIPGMLSKNAEVALIRNDQPVALLSLKGHLPGIAKISAHLSLSDEDINKIAQKITENLVNREIFFHKEFIEHNKRLTLAFKRILNLAKSMPGHEKLVEDVEMSHNQLLAQYGM